MWGEGVFLPQRSRTANHERHAVVAIDATGLTGTAMPAESTNRFRRVDREVAKTMVREAWLLRSEDFHGDSEESSFPMQLGSEEGK